MKKKWRKLQKKTKLKTSVEKALSRHNAKRSNQVILLRSSLQSRSRHVSMSCADGPDGNPNQVVNQEEAARKAIIEAIANDMS